MKNVFLNKELVPSPIIQDRVRELVKVSACKRKRERETWKECKGLILHEKQVGVLERKRKRACVGV